MIRPTRRLRCLSIEALEGRALMSAGLDTSFGQGGQVVGDFGAPPGLLALADSVDAVAIQPDGKIVVVGVREHQYDLDTPLVVARYNADGSVDSTFGTGGVAVVYGGPATMGGNVGNVARSVLIQPDGKIVVGVEVGAFNFAPTIFRLDADGSPDTGFGDNGSFTSSNNNLFALDALALQPDGKIVAVGRDIPGSFSAERLNSDGTPDASFGTAGVALVPSPEPLTEFATALAVALQPDGKIILAGSTNRISNAPAPPPQAAAIRLDADGAFDASFGHLGYVSGPLGEFDSVAVQADGKVDLALSYATTDVPGVSNDFAVTRLNADGSVDQGYDGAIASLNDATAPSTDIGPYADSLAIDAAGRVVTVGGGPSFNAVRLTTEGNLDASFAPGGILPVLSPVASIFNSEGKPADLAIQPDGKIIVASSRYINGNSGIGGFTLTRIDPGQAPNDYFGTGQSDAAIELPNLGLVAIRPSNGGNDQVIPFGIAGAGQTIPAPGDYTGSGKTEIGVYLPGLGEFVYRPSDGGPDVLVPFGFAGAGQTIPAPADYEGTGRSDIAAYLPSLGEFAIRQPTGPDELVPFGIAGAGQSIPVPGDYEGTGRDDIAVYLPSIGAYAIRPSTGGADEIIPFGIAGGGQSIPVPGDYDGSGKTEIAVYLPSLGEFAYRPANGGPDVLTPFGLAGAGQTLPMPGDYDGSGKTELAVYLPSLGDFAYRPAGGGPDLLQGFGIPGRSIPFTTNPPSDTLPMTLSAASVSADSAGWVDVIPTSSKPKKASTDLAPADVPTVG